MFVQKVPHIKDQFLTQERASMELESGQIAVGWYTNEQDSQSVVHSHPYYELVLPLVGSNVRYSVDGNIYDINLGEMIIFPARCYHAGMFNITDKISERLIAQINAELWQEALLASGLVAPTWPGQLVILDADAVIEIKGIEHEKSFEIEITDSGIGMSEKQLAILRRKLRMRLNSDTQPKHGIGLRNVQDRIHIQFGTEYGLSVYTKEHCYTKVSIHLPITRGKYSPMDQEGDEKEEEKENEYTAGCRR
jgi:hypothetical protein